VASATRTVKQGGNIGRKFHVCSKKDSATQCSFYVWEDGLGNVAKQMEYAATVAAQAATKKVVYRRGCTRCGRASHNASSCFAKTMAGSGGRRYRRKW
jgi:hypothetical protein